MSRRSDRHGAGRRDVQGVAHRDAQRDIRRDDRRDDRRDYWRDHQRDHQRDCQRGASLVELIVLIVVVGIVATAAMGALATMGSRSADPLVQRQALAVAQSLLDEITAQPTPDGDALGPEAGESRSSASTPFDHVNDYHGFGMTGIRSFDGTAVAGLESYSASVTVQAQAIGNVPAADGWWVEVRVTGPGGAEVVLAGWRARLSG